jgi:hypothetical protein
VIDPAEGERDGARNRERLEVAQDVRHLRDLLFAIRRESCPHPIGRLGRIPSEPGELRAQRTVEIPHTQRQTRPAVMNEEGHASEADDVRRFPLAGALQR